MDPHFSYRITHRGVVLRVAGSSYWIEIQLDDASGCNSCALAGKCGSASSAPGRIEVPAHLAAGLRPPAPGERVVVRSPRGGTAVAATLLLAVPLAAFVLALGLLRVGGAAEGVSVLGAFGACALALVCVHLYARGRSFWTIVETSDR